MKKIKTIEYEVLARFMSQKQLHLVWSWTWAWSYLGYYIMTEDQYRKYVAYKLIWLNHICGGWTKKSAWKRACQVLQRNT